MKSSRFPTHFSRSSVQCLVTRNVDTPEVFKALAYFGDRRSPIPSDLSSQVIDLLLAVVVDIKDAELRARIADVLWVLKKGGYQIPQLAVDAYIESAQSLEDLDHWTDSMLRIERALQIAKRLGKNNPSGKYTAVIQHIETTLSQINRIDPLFFSYYLMLLLFKNNEGDENIYIAHCEKIALDAESNRNWRKARFYWELKALWHQKAQNTELAYEANYKAANTFVHQSAEILEQQKPSYGLAAYELQSAIEALRKIQAPREYINQLHNQMLEYQRLDDDFVQTSIKFDVTKYATLAIDSVRGKSLRGAILALVTLVPITRKQSLKDQILQQMNRSPLMFYLSSLQKDEQGRTTTKRSALSEDNEEEVIYAEMYRLAGYEQERLARALILPAVHQINLEHSLRIHDLIEFVTHNAFIPANYEEIFLKGLYYGFMGDFMLSTHLLIPQIENSIRFLLEKRGIPTSYLNADEIQDVYDLNRLLNVVPEVKEMFSEDLFFDLRGLLVNRSGTNLRNNVAHGKLSAPAFSHLRGVYFWWLVLYLCCYPLIHEQKQTDTPNNGETNAPEDLTKSEE